MYEFNIDKDKIALEVFKQHFYKKDVDAVR